jgi:hypothetical protein
MSAFPDAVGSKADIPIWSLVSANPEAVMAQAADGSATDVMLQVRLVDKYWVCLILERIF